MLKQPLIQRITREDKTAIKEAKGLRRGLYYLSPDLNF